MIRKLASMAIIITGAVIALATIHPMATPAVREAVVLPIATTPVPTLAPCEYEDGSGQDVCAWDADTMGNGVGTDVVAGECSIDSVGSVQASALCVRLWAKPASHVELGNGASSDTSDGKALVGECTDIEFEASQDKDMRDELNNDGWNLTECFKAMLNE
jgi:hypothetical protein